MNLTLARFKSLPQVSLRTLGKGGALLLAMVLGLAVAFPTHAINLTTLASDTTNPLASALTNLNGLNAGLKGLIAFIGFVVALVSLASLRNMGPVLFFVGLAVFAAVGLTVAASIMGATVVGIATIGAL